MMRRAHVLKHEVRSAARLGEPCAPRGDSYTALESLDGQDQNKIDPEQYQCRNCWCIYGYSKSFTYTVMLNLFPGVLNWFQLSPSSVHTFEDKERRKEAISRPSMRRGGFLCLDKIEHSHGVRSVHMFTKGLEAHS